MSKILLVFLGGGFGAGLRYFVAGSEWLRMDNGFPLGTLSVNLIGCFLIGVLWHLALEPNSFVKPLLIIGLLGGFTTFSSFGLESFQLYEQGKTNIMVLYILLSNIVGLLLVFLGYKLGTIIELNGSNNSIGI
jgi:CrcB protein